MSISVSSRSILRSALFFHSEATLYRLIDACALPARNVDLQERVKRKPRKRHILSKDAYAALNSFNKVLLANHIRTCVAEDIREGKDETIDELVKVLQKLMK